MPCPATTSPVFDLNLNDGREESMYSDLVIRSIPKTKFFSLEEDFTCHTSEGIFVVPLGFRTNLATIPEVLQSLIQNNAPYIREASVLHDYLYDKDTTYSYVSKNKADRLLIEGMSYLGASSLQCLFVWQAVHRFGDRYWRK